MTERVCVFSAEFLDDVMIDACNKFSSLSYPVTPTLFLEFHGSERSLEEQVKTTGKTLQKSPLQLASKGLDTLAQNLCICERVEATDAILPELLRLFRVFELGIVPATKTFGGLFQGCRYRLILDLEPLVDELGFDNGGTSEFVWFNLHLVLGCSLSSRRLLHAKSML